MDSGSISDAELSRQCRKGRSEAWRQLIRRCAPAAYRVALQTLRDPAEAEDACQEVFLRMYRSFHTYDPTRPLAPWVARITYNVCLRRREPLARRSTDPVAPGELDSYRAGGASDPERDAARREASDHLTHAMAALSAEDRALLTMRYREGLSGAELADAAEMPVNTVKTRIHRARARLRKALRPILRGEDR